MTQLQTMNNEENNEIIKQLILNGDLSRMNDLQKALYYKTFCEKLGLNTYAKPFQLISFQGKTMLYATRACTEELRKIHGVSIISMEKEFKGNDLYIVTCKVQDKYGRLDMATGAVSIKGLSGDALCNAIMKAETKAKRRATLSICGLGILDESETDTLGKIETKPIYTEEESKKEKELLIGKVNSAKDEDELIAIYKDAVKKFPNETAFIKELTTACANRKKVLLAAHQDFINELDVDQSQNIPSPENYADIRGS